MSALYEHFWLLGHVVSQVIKSKLIVCTKRDVTFIRLSTRLTVRLMSVNTVNSQTVEFINRTHPLRVSTRQIIIDCHQMDTSSCECIQEDWQRRHQRLSLSRVHLGHTSSMQCNATYELYIVVNHVPRNI